MTRRDKVRPDQLRQTALDLLDLADSLEQNQIPSHISRIRTKNLNKSLEEMGPKLAIIAHAEIQARSSRKKFIDADLIGEPAWDMLLDLFVQTVAGRRVSVTSLCIASNGPPTTALRYIGELQNRGLLLREKSKFDNRTSYLSLSDDAFRQIGGYLSSTLYVFDQVQVQKRLLFAMWLRA